jgi:hypothetical protein
MYIRYERGVEVVSKLAEQIARYDEAHTFARRVVLPEEERRRLFPAETWTGGYRWFRSPNVVCLEKYRRLKNWANG